MTAPLSIAIVAPSRFPIRPPFAGGLEAHVWHLTRELAERGHRVSLFAAEGSAVAPDCPQVSVHPLQRSVFARTRRPLPGAVFESDYRAYLRLMLELAGRRAHDFDVIHNHSLHQLPIAMAPRLSTPMLTTFHTPPFTWLESAIGATRGKGSAFAAVSRHTATAWGRVLNRVLVVPNGVDVSRWPAGRGGRYLVWSGRITQEKGTHLAIEAARRAGMPLRLAGPIGSAEYFREHIAPQLGDSTIYEGHLDQAELAVLVGGAAAALVTPLWDEPYGLVVAEALACGTPVVAFARGGIPEVVDTRSGRLVRPRDVAAMAAAIPEAIRLSRQDVRAHAMAACSAQTMVTRYLSIYRDLIEEQDSAVDDRLLRAPSGPRASRQSIEHLRTPA